jgi:hypothetical protein
LFTRSINSINEAMVCTSFPHPACAQLKSGAPEPVRAGALTLISYRAWDAKDMSRRTRSTLGRQELRNAHRPRGRER